MSRFKVGDIIEATQEGRWLIGKIAYVESPSIYDLSIAVKVYDTRIVDSEAVALHVCSHDNTQVFQEPIGYWVSPKNSKIAKSYIVSEIIKDL